VRIRVPSKKIRERFLLVYELEGIVSREQIEAFLSSARAEKKLLIKRGKKIRLRDGGIVCGSESMGFVYDLYGWHSYVGQFLSKP